MTALLLQRGRRLSPTLRGAVEDLGMRVVVRRTVRDALIRLRLDQPSLVMLTINTVRRRDIEIVMRMRALSNAIIVVACENVDPSGGARILEAGADEYVAQSIEQIRLTARLRAKLRRGEMPPPPSSS